MTSPLWGKYCDGGHYCSAPKECCTLGCCYHTLPTNGVLSLWFLGHWSFWALVMAAVLVVLCACSLWRRCWRALRFRTTCNCCGTGCTSCTIISSGREDRASEPDSTGSCYAPPHYSRCNSFHHAPPPPYAEVTSKPDLYPLVISYNGDTGMKRGGSASYLMVQYFRNYILRPSGSISATSTIDSLSSSFICNAANEANTVIPPPYSCTGSLEGFTFATNSVSNCDSQMVHSASSQTCDEIHQTNGHKNVSTASQSSTENLTPNLTHNRISTPNGQNSNLQPKNSNYSPVYVHNKTTSFINNLSKERLNEFACYKGADTEPSLPKRQIRKNKISTENSLDSDENNFSELLNLSVCAPTSILNVDLNTLTEFGSREISEQQNYSITNSVTVSDISSLANLGSPDSPPRATSPTVEIRELLDKIQQLPQQKSPAPPEIQQSSTKNCRIVVKNKSKTLYMPLNTTCNQQNSLKLSPSSSGKYSGNIFVQNSSFYGRTKGWLSRSAPTTPCGNFVPLFPSQRKNVVPKSHMGSKNNSKNNSKSKMDDASALLTEFDGSDDDIHNNVRL